MSERHVASSAGGELVLASDASAFVQLGMPSPATCSGFSTGASAAATAAYASRSRPWLETDETDASDPDARARARRVSWMLRKLAACSRKPSARGRLFRASGLGASETLSPAFGEPGAEGPAVSVRSANASASSPRRARKPVSATDAWRSAIAKPPAPSRRNPSPRAPPSPSACSRGSKPGCCACSRSLSTDSGPSTRRRASASSNAATRCACSSVSSGRIKGAAFAPFAAGPANSYSGDAGSTAPGGRSETRAASSAPRRAASRRSTSGSTESRGAARPPTRAPRDPGVGTYASFHTKEQGCSGNASVSWSNDCPLWLRDSASASAAARAAAAAAGSASSATSPG